MLTPSLIEHVLTTIPRRTIGVLGDLFLDRYLDIDATRNEPSVETGLTAYQVVSVRSYPGAAGTVVNNLSALGVGQIYPIAVIGDDGEGYELRQALQATRGFEPGGVVLDPGRRTPTYTKPMLMEAGQPPRELNRLDIKNRAPTPDVVQDRILALLDEAWPRLDALIVLDQVSEEDCGVVTKRVRERLAVLGKRDPTRFVLADSREQIGKFRNVCVKPNRPESERWIRIWNFPLDDPEFDPGKAFSNRIGRPVFFTNGPEGILIWSREAVGVAPAYPVTGPIDIVGAGDSCSAGITSAMVAGLTHEQAAAFGNLVASITVQQIGVTGTASPEQVRARWREVENR